jgi:hypothetical protein
VPWPAADGGQDPTWNETLFFQISNETELLVTVRVVLQQLSYQQLLAGRLGRSAANVVAGCSHSSVGWCTMVWVQQLLPRAWKVVLAGTAGCSTSLNTAAASRRYECGWDLQAGQPAVFTQSRCLLQRCVGLRQQHCVGPTQG